MNVVEQWRDRPRSLRGEYWRCTHCGRFSAVRRARCAQCGSSDALGLEQLPATLMARGWSHAHLVIEALDQTVRTKPVMLMELPGGEKLPIALAAADRAHAQELVGAKLRVVLRRTRTSSGDGPIVYGRKVAADAETRLAIMKKSDIAVREKGDG